MMADKVIKNTVEGWQVDSALQKSERLLTSKIRFTVKHISRETLEKAIEDKLAAEEINRHLRSLMALQAGALFHVLKKQMGTGYSGFWSYCEQRFHVCRATISRKMRLVANFVHQNGGDPKLVTELIDAANIDPTKPKDSPRAVQLALPWIGDLDLSDLYRREKLINYGPQGGDRRSGRDIPRRTNAEIEFDDKKAQAIQCFKMLKPQLARMLDVPLYPYLADEPLQELSDLLFDLKTAVNALRAQRRLPDRKKERLP